MKLFSERKDEGIILDVYSFNSLIIGFCKTGRIERVMNLFYLMVQFGATLDIYTHNTFIKALCCAKRVEEAKEAALIMEANDCNGNSYSYQWSSRIPINGTMKQDGRVSKCYFKHNGSQIKFDFE
ncbi:Pentatricopeptide repeat-containing protein [Apostasia shenzhenica]|uniref:Pentatricopeptide repeat-containing protein n=1 Tax=Apostasia shenzhenica TaxID=1088818 RepID=A0A2I0B5B6_9ASPA|nr:Pentatricopeptide repeat-containing protein [Apostasia shenzhenica]